MADLPEGFVVDKLPEGFEVDQGPSTGADVAKSIAIGVPKGIIAGLGTPGDIRSLASRGVDWAGEALGASPETIGRFKTGAQAAAHLVPGIGPALATGPTSHDIQGAVEGVTGKFYEPKTTAGKFVGAATEFAANPVSYAGPGGWLGKAAQAATAGLGSEAAGELAEGTSLETPARIAGAIIGGKAPRAAARAVTPFALTPERQAAVNALRAEGVEPTAGQFSGNKTLRYAESELGDAPFSGAAGTREYQRVADEFTRAALSRIGERATKATPEVLERAGTRIGNEFDRMAASYPSRMDPQYLNDIFKAEQDYGHLFVDPLRKPVVEHIIQHATNQLVQNPVLDGAQYKALRSRIERMRRGSRDPEVNDFLADVRDAMDNLVERNIGHVNPADLGAWGDVRNQYRNLLALEKINRGAGEAAASGVISPAKLRQAAVAQSGRAYSRGRGDFGELARAGEEIMSPLPQSGTAPRAAVRTIPALVGAGLTSLFTGGGPEALLAGLGAFGGTGMAGRGLMSRPIQNWLKFQGAAPVVRALPRSGLRPALAATHYTAPDASPFEMPRASPFAP